MDFSIDYFLADPNLEKVYVGCRQWAIDEPEEVLDWLQHEVRQKDISGLSRRESALLAMLTGFTEGIARHDLTQAFEVEYAMGWTEDCYDAVQCGLYPEYERRSIQELLRWCGSLRGQYDTDFTVLDGIKRRVVAENLEEFIAWIEDDSNPELFKWREPGNSVSLVASKDLDRAIEWVRDLEARRSEPAAREILGYYGDAYVSIASVWCERDRHEFIDWAIKQLRENPTDELYYSWHRAISKMAYEWPKDDIQYVEKAVFMLDGGAVNFPGIYWYLYHLPDAKVLALSEKWLGESSMATETQKNEMRKAFGHAIMFFDKPLARQMFGQLKDEKQRRMFLAGVDGLGKKGIGWWMRWRHDIGIRRIPHWGDQPKQY